MDPVWTDSQRQWIVCYSPAVLVKRASYSGVVSV